MRDAFRRRLLPPLASALLLAVPLVGTPGGVSRAQSPGGWLPGAASGPLARSLGGFFATPPRAGQPPPRPQMPPGPAGPPPARPATAAGQGPAAPGEACRVAILQAAARYRIPPDLMLAISLVESGHRDPVTGTRLPWPWTANLDGQDYRFETSAQAAAWVRQQQAAGHASIDTGCMQVNLKFHPDAFASAEDAFDPVRNADYAARFLRALYDGPAGGVWMQAAGFYHSQTPELAGGYRGLVEAAMKAPLPSQTAPSPVLPTPPPPAPFRPGGGGQFLSNHAEMARIIPIAGGQQGRGLDAYRAMPVFVASRGAPLRVTTAVR